MSCASSIPGASPLFLTPAPCLLDSPASGISSTTCVKIIPGTSLPSLGAPSFSPDLFIQTLCNVLLSAFIPGASPSLFKPLSG